MAMRETGDKEKGDERILGSGAFVTLITQLSLKNDRFCRPKDLNPLISLIKIFY